MATMKRHMMTAGKFLAFIFLALVSAFSLLFVYLNTILDSGNLEWNSWAYSELLINYRGGFVRRGFLGELIFAAVDGAPAIHLVNTLVFIGFIVLMLALLLLVVVFFRSSISAILIFFMPASVVSMAVWNEYYFRKEILFEIAFVLLALLIHFLRGLSFPRMKTAVELVAYGGIAGLLVIFMLIHEGFFFICTPVLCAMIILYMRDERGRPEYGHSAAMGVFLLTLIGFIVAIFHHGGAETSARIWSSLTVTDRCLIHPDGELEGGIAAIGWSFLRSLRNPGGILASGTLWIWMSMLFFNLLYITVLVIAIERNAKANLKDAASNTTIFLRYYALFFLCSFPLYLIGWDWGRWISTVNILFVIFYALFRNRPSGIGFMHDPQASVLVESLVERVYRYPRSIIGAAVVLSAITRIPECCIGISKVALQNMWDSLMFLTSLG